MLNNEIEEGVNSGWVSDFDAAAYLKEIKDIFNNKKGGGIKEKDTRYNDRIDNKYIEKNNKYIEFNNKYIEFNNEYIEFNNKIDDKYICNKFNKKKVENKKVRFKNNKCF